MAFTVYLLGDMWAQSWERLYDFTRPYPTIDDVNPTSAMINQVTNPFSVFVRIKKNVLFFFIKSVFSIII